MLPEKLPVPSRPDVDAVLAAAAAATAAATAAADEEPPLLPVEIWVVGTLCGLGRTGSEGSARAFRTLSRELGTAAFPDLQVIKLRCNPTGKARLTPANARPLMPLRPFTPYAKEGRVLEQGSAEEEELPLMVEPMILPSLPPPAPTTPVTQWGCFSG